MRANAIFVALIDGVVYIEDANDGGMSITNDAEAVVREYGKHGHRVVSKDTMGQWDELVHEDGVFKDFATWSGWTPDE